MSDTPTATSASELRMQTRRIAARFRRPWHRDYARAKLRWDPVYSAVASIVSEHPAGVLDIGCGLGLLGFYLRECGFRGDYRGIDFDAPKIAEARRIAHAGHLGLAFDDGDAAALLPSFSGHVALLDVLHYLSAANQQSLLTDAATRVGLGATLIVRSVLRDTGWRFRATVWQERLAHGIGWMHSPPLHYPLATELETALSNAGLVVESRPLWGNTPFNSFLVVARRLPSAD